MTGCCAISDSSIRQSVVLLDEESSRCAEQLPLGASEAGRVGAEVERLAEPGQAGRVAN